MQGNETLSDTVGFDASWMPEEVLWPEESFVPDSTDNSVASTLGDACAESEQPVVSFPIANGLSETVVQTLNYMVETEFWQSLLKVQEVLGASRRPLARSPTKRSRSDKPAEPRASKRVRYSEDVREELMRWLETHREKPYPTLQEKEEMSLRTGMSVQQVSNWFANARRRILRRGDDDAASLDDCNNQC